MRSCALVLVGSLVLGCAGTEPKKGNGNTEEPGGEGGGGDATGGKPSTPTKPSGDKADSAAPSTGGSSGTPDAAAPTSDTAAPAPEGSDAAAPTADTASGGPPAAGMGIYAGMTKIFDGTTLDGWEQRPANSWQVTEGAMASKGSGRGYINTKADYGDYRLIFTLRQVSGNHQPCILIYGTRPPPNDALGAIQVQPPNGYTWDYRPGHNTSGAALFTKYDHPKLDAKKWNQCEVLVKQSGTFRFACCEVTNGPCKAVESLKFNDPTAGRKGPIAWQMHNGGIHDEYKDVYVEENPKVDDLITTK